MFLPWFLCIVLLGIIIILLIKIIFVNRNIDKICTELAEHLSDETNTLILVSTGDRHIKHLANELNKQLQLLKQERHNYLNGGQKLKEAVTNISHDLRTPLTAIYGYLDLLEEEEDKSLDVERYIKIISNRVESLKQLTDELFLYSLSIISQNNDNKEDIILNDILEDSLADFYMAFKERGIIPKINMPTEKVICHLNPAALSRVFTNLLSNAIKYSDGDLEITITDYGEITFTNTAVNLNQIEIERLFDRFYTVNTAKKSTGLGLEISKTLIQQMNGEISAEYKNKKLFINILLPLNQ